MNISEMPKRKEKALTCSNFVLIKKLKKSTNIKKYIHPKGQKMTKEWLHITGAATVQLH